MAQPFASRLGTVLGAALLGGATGLRSQMGLAVVERGSAPATLPAPLRRSSVKRAMLAAAGGELVADKLPFAPPRTAPPSLVARICCGAAAGALSASTVRSPAVVPAVVGGASAAGATFAGLSGRMALSRRIPPLLAAIVEDGIAFAVASLGFQMMRSVNRSGAEGAAAP